MHVRLIDSSTIKAPRMFPSVVMRQRSGMLTQVTSLTTVQRGDTIRATNELASSSLRACCEKSFSLGIAIDFTGSNGSPDDSGSLHARNLGQTNAYFTAIKDFADPFTRFATGKPQSIYGFGFTTTQFPDKFGPVKNDSDVGTYTSKLDDIFYNDANNRSVKPTGAGLLIECYKHFLESVERFPMKKSTDTFRFAGPTNYNQVAADIFKDGGSEHQILIMFTDGDPTDTNVGGANLFENAARNVKQNQSWVIIKVNGDFTDETCLRIMKNQSQFPNIKLFGISNATKNVMCEEIFNWIQQRSYSII